MTPSVLASSHREAPFITELPKVERHDFYICRSLSAQPRGLRHHHRQLRPAAGRRWWPRTASSMDPEALYEIHIDNDGDTIEDLTFQFDFDLALNGGAGRGIELAVGEAGAERQTGGAVPRWRPVIAGPVNGPNAANPEACARRTASAW